MSGKAARTPLLGLAALAVAGVAFGIFATRTSSPLPELELPDGQSYRIRPMAFDPPQLRQAAGSSKHWQEAGAAYQAGDYARSERLFARVESGQVSDPVRHDAALYRGISQLMNGRADQAAETLQRSREMAKELGLRGSADNFYLGVAAMAGDDSALAGEALEQAVGSAFDADARMLLARLSGD